MEKTIAVNTYTGTWNARMATGRSSGLSRGDTLRIHASCDGREWDDLRQILRREGKALEFDRADGEWNLYTVASADADANGRLSECAYCGGDVTETYDIPAPDDSAAWARLAADHAADCEWVATRAHRREAP